MGLNDARLRIEYSIVEGMRSCEGAPLARVGRGAIFFVESPLIALLRVSREALRFAQGKPAVQGAG
jgi:hypothetical protein